MNKYLRPMRSVTSKAQLAWTTQKETEILNGRLDQANLNYGLVLPLVTSVKHLVHI